MDNSPQYLFLASGTKDGEGFWIVGVKYCDDNIFDAINIYYSIYENGYSVIDILDNYFIYIKNITYLSDNIKFIIIKLLCEYISVFYEIHEEKLELALFTNNLYKKMRVT